MNNSVKSIEIIVVLGVFSFKVTGRDLIEVKTKMYDSIYEIGIKERVNSARVSFVIREKSLGVTDTRDCVLKFKESETIIDAIGKCFIKLDLDDLFNEDNYEVEPHSNDNSLYKITVIVGSKNMIFLRARGSIDSVKKTIETVMLDRDFPVDFLRVQITIKEFSKLSELSRVIILNSKFILGFNYLLESTETLSEIVASKIEKVRGN